MCGIMGYIGKENALPLIMEGLKKESYRGYDSSGLVLFDGEKTHYIKAVGKLEKLAEKIAGQVVAGTVGLGHNRWATHGGVSEQNAHPHVDCKQNIFVVHNGIIENYHVLKEALQTKGHVFVSETDTEVLAHLIESFMPADEAGFEGDLEEAVRKALLLVKGTYGLAVIAKQDPNKIVAARLSSPLVICKTSHGVFVASDPAAVISHSKNMVFLDDKELAVITSNGFSVMDLENKVKEKPTTTLLWNVEEIQKAGYAHFMEKEICQQPETLAQALAGRVLIEEGTAKLGGLEGLQEKLKDITSIQIIACGTASFAARIGEYMLEELAGLLVKVEVASEFRYKNPVFGPKTLSIFVSQSGETADTLAALRLAKEKGSLTLGIVNVVGSTLAREAGYGVYTHAGPEIAVASTKAFTAQLTVMALVALFLARQRGLSLKKGQELAKELLRLPELVGQILQQKETIKQLAEKYKNSQNFWFTGRKYNYPIALEGALKLKEVSYIHAEGIAGGELKHGPISLIGPDFPTVAIVPSDSVYDKMISNIQEIKARNGKVIAIATQGNEDIKRLADEVIYIPKTLELLQPVLTTIPLQLFAYYMGVQKGYDVDQPRNLAKSVTVE